ncbi:MAG: proline dehydrogenase family protein [Ignavibacteriales bacterium]|nr:proline dehydrogenase family protein [Ignavibacteriales bacterium]
MSILNKLVVAALPIIPKSVVGQVAKRYIAGTTLPDAVRIVKGLNAKGMVSTTDLLGEYISEAKEAHQVRDNIFLILQEIKNNQLNSNVSIKPTQLGLKIDKELCYQNIRSLVEEAKKLGNFVRIDMEDATTTDGTLEIYRRLRKEGYSNVGVVIQAYLHRSESDVRALIKEGANLRLCKGIYNESPSIAYKDRQQIRENYLKLLQIMFEGGSYVGIATHDDYLIGEAYKLVQKYGLKRDQYEFQMLLGVRETLRDQIVNDGHRLRVYVPYGEQWYAYSTRRLKENPYMAWYITKAIFVR